MDWAKELIACAKPRRGQAHLVWHLSYSRFADNPDRMTLCGKRGISSEERRLFSKAELMKLADDTNRLCLRCETVAPW